MAWHYNLSKSILKNKGTKSNFLQAQIFFSTCIQVFHSAEMSYKIICHPSIINTKIL